MKRLLLCVLACYTSMLFAKEWNFRVSLDNHEIGRHRFVLENDGEQLKLKSEASFDYRLLFFSAFRYDHRDVEFWRDDCLSGLSSITTTNGKAEQVQARRIEDKLLVEYDNRQIEYDGCVKTFAYWNQDILKERRLLNSQTGEYMPVTIDKIGDESINVQGSLKLAERYRINGNRLRIDVWYVGGNWVALEADTGGGRMLKYQLR